jgi:hypothetical protein
VGDLLVKCRHLQIVLLDILPPNVSIILRYDFCIDSIDVMRYTVAQVLAAEYGPERCHIE